MYAECIKEDSGEGYYTLRYLVYNGDIIGSYGVHFNARDKPYGASRDYHRVATVEEVKDSAARERFLALPDAEQRALESRDEEPDYCHYVHTCMYHDNKACVCDGSSLVEIVVNDDKRAYGIAAMMAEVKR